MDGDKSRERTFQEILREVEDQQTFLRRASAALVRFLPRGSSWLWAEWISEVLQLDAHHPLVRDVATKLTAAEKPYYSTNYDHASGTERIAVRLMDLSRRWLQRKIEAG